MNVLLRQTCQRIPREPIRCDIERGTPSFFGGPPFFRVPSLFSGGHRSNVAVHKRFCTFSARVSVQACVCSRNDPVHPAVWRSYRRSICAVYFNVCSVYIFICFFFSTGVWSIGFFVYRFDLFLRVGKFSIGFFVNKSG